MLLVPGLLRAVAAMRSHGTGFECLRMRPAPHLAGFQRLPALRYGRIQMPQ
jgi:hypothetical protein